MRLSELRNVFADGSICSETIELSQGSSCGTHFEGAAPILRAHRKNGKIPLPPGSSTSQWRISVPGHTFQWRPQFNTRSSFSFPLSKTSSGGSWGFLQAAGPWKTLSPLQGEKFGVKNPGKTWQFRIVVWGYTFQRRPQFNTRSVFSFPLSKTSFGGSWGFLQGAGP